MWSEENSRKMELQHLVSPSRHAAAHRPIFGQGLLGKEHVTTL
jgi:hypothetical protein